MFWTEITADFSVVQLNIFFFLQCHSKIVVVESTISHITMRFRRIRRPPGLGRQLKFRFLRPRSRADELAAVVGPPIPLLLNTDQYIPVQTRSKILKYVANMPCRAVRRPNENQNEKVARHEFIFWEIQSYNSSLYYQLTSVIRRKLWALKRIIINDSFRNNKKLADYSLRQRNIELNVWFYLKINKKRKYYDTFLQCKINELCESSLVRQILS